MVVSAIGLKEVGAFKRLFYMGFILALYYQVRLIVHGEEIKFFG